MHRLMASHKVYTNPLADIYQYEMKQKISLFIILLLLSSCGSQDDFSSFIPEDIDKYNNQIFSAIEIKEAWATTPYLIVGKLFGPQYLTEGNAGFALEQDEISNEHVKVIVTQEGLLDDSVYGEKRIIEFKYKSNIWTIDKIKLGFKCHLKRGQQNYSGEPCS